MRGKAKKTRIVSSVLVALLLFLNCIPGFAQDISCSSLQITPLQHNPVKIPTTPGDTNNDITFEGSDQFADLDLPLTPQEKILSLCVSKNNSARILNINPETGSLTLSNSVAQTDNVTKDRPASIRGICSLSPDGQHLFFPGNGPMEFGFDRIYPYRVDSTDTIKFRRARKEEKGDNYFIPSDLATSVAVTPNGKYLVYLQANTTNNNLASIQSIEIKPDETLGESFVGQDLADLVSAGTYLEFAKADKDSKEVLGIFSNLQRGKPGSGDGFAIFKTNQTNGVNTILSEYKQGKERTNLPNIFNKDSFGGFSGFKLLTRNSDVYLFISYFENDPVLFQGLNKVTKLATFKINTETNLNGEESAKLIQVGKSAITVFKTDPCNKNNFHGISGPIWANDKFLYIADNQSSENYLGAYSINWDAIDSEAEETQTVKLASIPIQTNKTSDEKNTDLVVTLNNKFAYIVSTKKQGGTEAKIYGYLLKHSNIACSELKHSLAQNGLCELEQRTPSVDNIAENNLPETPDLSPEKSTKDSQEIEIKPENIPPPQIVQLPNSFPTQQPIQQIQPIGRPGSSFAPGTGRPIPLFGGPYDEFDLPQQPPPTQTTDNIALLPPPTNSNFPPSLPKPAPQIAQDQAQKTTQKPDFPPPPPKPPSFYKKLKEHNEKVIAQRTKLELPDIPDIKLIPTETKSIKSDTSQIIDIKSLNLSGPDQVIILPKVPLIPKPKTQILKAESTSSADSTKSKKSESKEPENKQEVIEEKSIKTSETRGIIRGGTAGITVNLKQKIKLNKKDLKNIIHVLVNKNEVKVIPSSTELIEGNKLLVKLSLPRDINSDSATFATLLNKKGGKKLVIAKSTIKIFEPMEFQNGNAIAKIGSPIVNDVQGYISGDSKDGKNKIVRLTFSGINFAARIIKSNNNTFIAESSRTHTLISFTEERDIEILKVRVLEKGDKMLVTLKFAGKDISSIPFTVSTPQGQFFDNKITIKLATNKSSEEDVTQESNDNPNENEKDKDKVTLDLDKSNKNN